MDFKMGSMEELNYMLQLVQNKCDDINDIKLQEDGKIFDVKEYKYLQFLVFKYCFIPNVVLSFS